VSAPSGWVPLDSHARALPVTLREVTRHNIQTLMMLDAGEGGRQVASNAKSMAQAAVYGEAWPRAIYAGDDVVGFIMLYDPSRVAEPEDPEFFLWRLMVDHEWQGRGIGLAALRLLIEHVRTRPHLGEMYTSIVEPAPQLLRFYGQAGFEVIDRYIDGERVLRLLL
jgi:diamine N-acetyltransferase